MAAPLEKKYEYLLNTASGKAWKNVGLRRRSGVCVALFGVYSNNSVGIGDIGDLKHLIDWAHLTGSSIIQLLPMNQVGAWFCPYDSLSSFALDPMYISLNDAVPADDNTLNSKLEELRKRFPAGKPFVDYAVKEAKISLLREVFSGIKASSLAGFEEFKRGNAYWLPDFTFYLCLKMLHKGLAWYDWQEPFRRRDPAALADFEKTNKQEIDFQAWLQWQMFLQFKSAKEYALSKKILLKGDLPMLVSRDSADTWAHPEFFKLGLAAGAPPDMYCARGQRWGMPTYNWERIEQDGYRYLKEKLKYAENFYDILRVDHVVGLFRIWSIPFNEPLENKGLNGFFDPADESGWYGHGRNILLAMAGSTKMLLCAEDLGIIPGSCTDTLKELGIPGNDVQRWAKDWNVRHDFLMPQEYRELSVAMLSTHDTTNWPAWWENEAGTVDEALFIRKCNERAIDFIKVRETLFDNGYSCHGRLRWLGGIDSIEKLVSALGKRGDEVGDFIDLYLNAYREKEKLWRHFGLRGKMREQCDGQILKEAIKISLASSSIFCINMLNDLLFLAEAFEGDAYQYRINTPGTTGEKNWSQALPISLEELFRHKVNKEIRKMVSHSGRI